MKSYVELKIHVEFEDNKVKITPIMTSASKNIDPEKLRALKIHLLGIEKLYQEYLENPTEDLYLMANHLDWLLQIPGDLEYTDDDGVYDGYNSDIYHYRIGCGEIAVAVLDVRIYSDCDDEEIMDKIWQLAEEHGLEYDDATNIVYVESKTENGCIRYNARYIRKLQNFINDVAELFEKEA